MSTSQSYFLHKIYILDRGPAGFWLGAGMLRSDAQRKSLLQKLPPRPYKKAALRAAFAKLALTERLKPLLDYDLKHGTELVKTLEVYFNNCRNSVNTARDLFIHRNTLLYRLEQISKILDLDLNNNEQVLIIQLALKALIMVK